MVGLGWGCWWLCRSLSEFHPGSQCGRCGPCSLGVQQSYSDENLLEEVRKRLWNRDWWPKDQADLGPGQKQVFQQGPRSHEISECFADTAAALQRRLSLCGVAIPLQDDRGVQWCSFHARHQLVNHHVPYSHAILGGIPGIPHFQTLSWCCVVCSPETTAKVSHAHELYNFFRAELANQYHEEMEASISMTLLVGWLKVDDTHDMLLHLLASIYVVAV